MRGEKLEREEVVRIAKQNLEERETSVQ